MSILQDTMRKFWVPGIMNSKVDQSLALGSWLRTTGYHVVSVSSENEFSLQAGGLSDLANLFAASANRVMSSSFETIISINEVESAPRSTAWLIVKLYYAAYFAAHANLRVCGRICTTVDAVDLARIFEVAETYGLTGPLEKFSSGLYLLTLDSLTMTISFKGIRGRPHEALWQCYHDFLVYILDSVPGITPIQAQSDAIRMEIKKLLSVLQYRGSNGANWLSVVRNKVNYRQEYGVWHPYSLSRSVSENMHRGLNKRFISEANSSSIQIQGQPPSSEVLLFYNTCLFICSLMREIALDLGARSDDRRTIFNCGSISFLRHCKLA